MISQGARWRSWPTNVLAAFAVGVFSAACAVKRPPVLNDAGIPRCAPDAASHLLSVDALQCWFDAPHGRWRTLSQESHYAVLVVRIEVQSLRDAADIARRFVAVEHENFSEILIYAEPDAAGGLAKTRRVRWTKDGGYEEVEFTLRFAVPPSGASAAPIERRYETWPAGERFGPNLECVERTPVPLNS